MNTPEYLFPFLCLPRSNNVYLPYDPEGAIWCVEELLRSHPQFDLTEWSRVITPSILKRFDEVLLSNDKIFAFRIITKTLPLIKSCQIYEWVFICSTFINQLAQYEVDFLNCYTNLLNELYHYLLTVSQSLPEELHKSINGALRKSESFFLEQNNRLIALYNMSRALLIYWNADTRTAKSESLDRVMTYITESRKHAQLSDANAFIATVNQEINEHRQSANHQNDEIDQQWLPSAPAGHRNENRTKHNTKKKQKQKHQRDKHTNDPPPDNSPPDIPDLDWLPAEAPKKKKKKKKRNRNSSPLSRENQEEQSLSQNEDIHEDDESFLPAGAGATARNNNAMSSSDWSPVGGQYEFPYHQEDESNTNNWLLVSGRGRLRNLSAVDSRTDRSLSLSESAMDMEQLSASLESNQIRRLKQNDFDVWLKANDVNLPSPERLESKAPERILSVWSNFQSNSSCSADISSLISNLEDKLKKEKKTIAFGEFNLIKIFLHLVSEERASPRDSNVTAPVNLAELNQLLRTEYKQTDENEIIGAALSIDQLCESFVQNFNVSLNIYSGDTRWKRCCFTQSSKESAQFIPLLHLIGNKFALLKSVSMREIADLGPYENQIKNIMKEYLTAISNKRIDSCNKKPQRNYFKKRLVNLQSIVEGKQKSDQDLSVYSQSKSKWKYTWKEDAVKRLEDKPEKYKVCRLVLQDAHSGYAVPMGSSNDESITDRISLIGRRKCGRAFNGDRVIVKYYKKKITKLNANNQQESSYDEFGEVVHVLESNVEPINQLFICRMCSDQTSLMRPVCKTFPKIHVNNDPARQYYKLNHLTRDFNERNESGMVSEKERERHKEKYADQLFVSMHDLEVTDSQIETKSRQEEGVIKVNRLNCPSLFIVFYKKWDPSFLYPYGYVVGKIDFPDELEDYLPIIQIMSHIPIPNPNRFYAECKKIADSYSTKLQKDLRTKKVTDLRDVYTISIDNASTQDIDDAISIEDKETHYEIGVHITDVAEWISKDSPMDVDAKNRGTTFYPPAQLQKKGFNLNMLPDVLSEDVFSLREGCEKRCLSVLFVFPKSEAIDKSCLPESKICSTVIKVNKNLDKATIRQKVITDRPEDEQLQNNLRILLQIASKMRETRLGSSAFITVDKEDHSCFEASCMVEEFMLSANNTIADYLFDKFQDHVLYRCLEKSPVPAIQKLYSKNPEGLVLSEHLKRIHKLTGLCPRRQQQTNIDNSKVPQFLVQKLKSPNLEQDWRAAQMLLLDERNYPAVEIAFQDWLNVAESAQYTPQAKIGHFQLNYAHYVHFTSPIRRYSDIVVQRMVKAALQDELRPVYLIEELHALGIHLSRMTSISKRYDKACKSVALALNLRESTRPVQAIVHTVDNQEITFSMLQPIDEHFLCESMKVSNAVLGLEKIPEITTFPNGKISGKFSWQHRNFRIKEKQAESNQCFKHRVTLSNHLLEYTIKSDDLTRILHKLRNYNCLDWYNKRCYTDTMRLHITNLTEKLRPPTQTISLLSRNEVSDVNWELNGQLRNSSAVNFDTELSPGQVIQLYISKSQEKGLPKPSIKRVQFCRSFGVCVEHKTDPVASFCHEEKEAVTAELPQKYDNLKQYREKMLPVLRMESVSEAVQDGSNFTFHDMEIEWVDKRDNHLIYGLVSIPEFELERRQIRFSGEMGTFGRLESFFLGETNYDYVCIQCVDNYPANEVWCAHGFVTQAGTLKSGTKKNLPEITTCYIAFRLTSNATPPKPGAKDRKYSIEFLMKTVPALRQEAILLGLTNTDFAAKIVLGQKLEPTFYPEKEAVLSELRSHWKQLNQPYLNYAQNSALDNAFVRPLSLIWGPPGTGKTLTGCLLAYAYYLLNKNHNDKLNERKTSMSSSSSQNCSSKIDRIRHQVLYCGPSNASVDVVANTMDMKFKDYCPQILRVFGEQVEIEDFPVPGETENFSKSHASIQVPQSIQNISLHHLIRLPDKPKGHYINVFDKLFKAYFETQKTGNDMMPEGAPVIDRKLIKAYKMLVAEAKKEELQNHDIILCTTSVSGSPLLQNYCHFAQIIVDEAGMCKEPETLIPLAAGAASKCCKNAVLIGDHKQLRPIIIDSTASSLGLDISLFERYTQLDPQSVTMLRYQYRMHPSICDFPSSQFYQYKLVTNPSIAWTGLSQDLTWHPHVKFNGLNHNDICTNEDGYFIKGKHFAMKISMKENHVFVVHNDWPAKRKAPFLSIPQHIDQCYLDVPERIVFIHVEGKEETQLISTTEGSENSRMNLTEIDEVTRVFMALRSRFTSPRLARNYITVLTQYRLQMHKIKESLTKDHGIVNPKVTTVIRSQGSEDHYVIFSTVRSLAKENINEHPTPGWERQYLGFITDQNQVNVALTRAQKGLIIIGNSDLLKVNYMWKQLINNLESRGCLMKIRYSFLVQNTETPP